MPGRTSARAPRSSKSSGTSNNRTSDADVLEEGPSTSLREHVCNIFAEVQRSNTGHRKLLTALRKTQESCCYEPPTPPKNGAQDEFDENDFNAEVSRCILRVVPVKKSEPVGDRIVKFLGNFLKQATELDNEIFKSDEADAQTEYPETPTSRLTSAIISLMLPLLQAKDKVVRFRATQIISHIINTLDSIDDELFHHIRIGLLKRLRDKESNVRVQAVCGLGRLASDGEVDEDDEDSADDAAGGVLQKLLGVLQNDPSAEVRRSLLLNLPFTPSTLPFLLERARDLDGSIRRALFARLLPALGDFRHLSLTHREKLLRWGLRDRDDNVRKATGRLFYDRWIEDCARPRDENGQPAELRPEQAPEPSSEALMELLERIDVVNSGNDGGVALDAMKDFWAGRPDYCAFIRFDEDYWKEMTPESAFIARTFNDYCRAESVNDDLLDKLPEVTRVAYLLQTNINTLVELVSKLAVQEDAEEDSVHQEFIVEQLLYIALTLDYSDEVGRRTMFTLMREALAIAELPEEASKLVTEVLRMTCGTNATGEREFCGVILEAIAEVHDTIMGEDAQQEDPDESFHSAQSELSGHSTPKGQQTQEVDEDKIIKEIMVNMKCLHIAQCMLQNVECSLEQNAHLVTMLNNLVVPAVRSQEAPIRERGLLCLGLCCLLDKNLANENLSLFLHCFSKGHEQLQTIAIQIVGDILSAHPSLLVQTPVAAPGEEDANDTEHPLRKPVHKLFSKAMKSSSHSVQSTACAALCKLMLSAPAQGRSSRFSSILQMDDLLRLLVQAYFDPETVDNLALRQSLSYFIPVFCHSRVQNLECMGRIALSVLQWYVGLKEEMDVDGEEEVDSEMVGVNVVLAHLVDWTDDRKLAIAKHGGIDQDGSAGADGRVHLELANDLLERIMAVCSKQERKLFISALSKLNISPNADTERLSEISRLITDAIEERVAADATARNTLVKLQTSVNKAISSQADARNNERSRTQSMAPSSLDQDEEMAGVAGLDDDGDSVATVRQAVSGLNLASATTTPATSPRKRGPRSAPRSARARGRGTGTSSSAEAIDEEDESDGITSAMTTPARSPIKKYQSRFAAVPELGMQESSEDTADQENVPPLDPLDTPAASPTKRSRRKPSSNSEFDISDVKRPSMLARDVNLIDPPVKLEPSVRKSVLQVKQEDTAAAEAPRRRPRQTKAAAQGDVDASLAAKDAPRRSVRAGRRQTVLSEAEIEE